MTKAKHHNNNGRSYNEPNPEFGSYLKIKSKFPVLDMERTAELTYAARRGCKDSLDTLVCSNIGLVLRNALKMFKRGRGLEIMDVVQNGMDGLLRAIEGYDPSLGYKFSTYATWWIKQAIQRGYIDQGRAIRIPAHTNERLVAYMKEKSLEKSDKPRKAGSAEEGSVREDEIVRDALKVLNVHSLYSTMNDWHGEESSELIESIESPDNTRAECDLGEAIDSALDKLPERERMVIQCRFFNGMSLEETRNVLFNTGSIGGKKTAREAIRRIEDRALKRLRCRLKPYEEYAVAE
ncbi:sigma-70 family RNA polymerase sigma factor [Candidatus Pacearchaeota archaeon]|nr:sigma-70 family RNA polymerase sigma factor [Candidatus Pacearchaeota archaeon]